MHHNSLFVFGRFRSDPSSISLGIFFFFLMGVGCSFALNCAARNPLCQTAILIFIHCCQVTHSKVFQRMRLNTPWVSISNESSMGTPLGSLLLCCSQLCEPMCHPFVPRGDTSITDTMLSILLSRFRAFIPKNSNVFLLSSKTLVYPPPLFRTEMLCFKTREENCHILFISSGKATWNHCLF